MKLSDYVAGFLVENGVDHFFTLSGGGCMHLLDSMGNHPSLKYTCNLHEQACAIGGEAFAQYRNNLSVILVTTGPGGTNTITGVAGAFIDSTPMLVISGQVKRADLKGDSGLRQKGPQEIGIIELVRPVTKYAVTITDPQSIRYELEKAVAYALEGRRGPVWIDIPLDVQAAQVEPEQLRSYAKMERKEIVPEKLIQDVLGELLKSKKPVILAGNGIRLAGAEKEFSELIKLLKIPVLLTWKAIDLLDENDELNCGRPVTIA